MKREFTLGQTLAIFLGLALASVVAIMKLGAAAPVYPPGGVLNQDTVTSATPGVVYALGTNNQMVSYAYVTADSANTASVLIGATTNCYTFEVYPHGGAVQLPVRPGNNQLLQLDSWFVKSSAASQTVHITYQP